MRRTTGNADHEHLENLVAPLVRDVRKTLDPEYAIVFEEHRNEWEWQSRWAGSDSITSATIPEGLFNLDEPSARLSIVQTILDFDFDEVLEPWPRCPVHRDHPLDVTIHRGEVWWTCERTREPVVLLGELSTA